MRDASACSEGGKPRIATCNPRRRRRLERLSSTNRSRMSPGQLFLKPRPQPRRNHSTPAFQAIEEGTVSNRGILCRTCFAQTEKFSACLEIKRLFD